MKENGLGKFQYIKTRAQLTGKEFSTRVKVLIVKTIANVVSENHPSKQLRETPSYKTIYKKNEGKDGHLIAVSRGYCRDHLIAKAVLDGKSN